jgi:hypothetical protein
MRHPQRRVRKLSLVSNSESSLNADLLALQDAFNIASLNGLPPNGLLLVRRLDLGGFSPRASAQAISGIIDKQVRNLSHEAVCVDHQDASHANVVWFSDPFNAVIRLVDMACKQKHVSSWYWPLLFRGYTPAMSLSETLVLVSREGQHKHSALALMAAVIQHQVEQGNIDKTLAAITPQLAQSLLTESGFFPHVIPESGRDRGARLTQYSLPEAWKRACEQSVLRWGVTDARSQWMVVNALVSHNPALLDTGSLLMLEADNLIQQLQHRIESPANQTAEGSQVHDNSRATGDGGQAPICTKDADPESSVYREQTNQSRALTGEKPPVVAIDNEAPSGETTVKQGNEGRKASPIDKHDSGISLPDTAYKAEIDPAAVSENRENEYRLDSGEDAANDNPVVNESEETTRFQANHHPQSGFLFVVSILQALNIDDCLKLNPQLALSNLPVRIIRRLAHRHGIDEGHPLLQCLTGFKTGNDAIQRFVCPRLWLDLLALRHRHPLTLYRYTSDDNPARCVITGHHHKLLLFVGDAEDIPEWINHHRVVTKYSGLRTTQLADIETSVILLINRFLNRYASAALRGLINRGGRIVHTRTHLDVVFDPEQIDIDIRRAGLDIDPGWVSWLGRVVQYHYISGDLDDD